MRQVFSCPDPPEMKLGMEFANIFCGMSGNDAGIKKGEFGKMGYFRPNDTKTPLLVSMEDSEIVILYNGEKVFSISPDSFDAKKQRQFITALREILVHIPPEECCDVIDNGIAIDFSDPELEKLIQDETAMKTVRQ